MMKVIIWCIYIYIYIDVFKKFKDTEGNFKVCLANDIQGMLSLYEAVHLRVHGEDILEEALTFATTHLKSITTDMCPPPLLVKLRHALDQPIHKDLPWLGAKHYISIYEQEASHSEVLLKFAKLNFNFLKGTCRYDNVSFLNVRSLISYYIITINLLY